MNSDTFVSYAQNGEDVLLWRALGNVHEGRYVDIGAWDAVEHSVTKAFYDRGWRGVNVEPVPELAARFREARPDDVVVEAAVTSSDEETLVLHRIRQPQLDGSITGLSTLRDDVADTHGHDARFEVDEVVVPVRSLTDIFDSFGDDEPVHFLKIDVEGAEAAVLESMDFEKHRPWVLVVEATAPNSTRQTHEEWEPLVLAAGYDFAIFDGLSRYYVASEHADLAAVLSYPVCVFDSYVKADDVAVRRELAEERALRAADRERLWADLVYWRNVALDSWTRAFAEREKLATQLEAVRARARARTRQIRRLRAEVERLENSASWRVTRPLRWARSQPTVRATARKVARR